MAVCAGRAGVPSYVSRSRVDGGIRLLMRTQSFFIPYMLPGLNEIIAASKVRRGKWSQYLDMKDSIGQYCALHIRKAKLKPMHRAALIFEWREPTMKRDLDNIACGKKFVNDALVACGILPNDGWAHVSSLTDHFVKVGRKECGVQVVMIEEQP